MFISEDEAKRRLNNKDNLLNRLNKPVEEESASLEDVKDLLKIQNPTSASRNDPQKVSELIERRLSKPAGARGGRFSGTTNIPPIFQELIGTATQVKSGRYAGDSFGVNSVHAHHLSHGRHSNDYDKGVDENLLQKIEHNTLEIRDRVLGVLTNTVAGITPDKLDGKDAKELSIIAKNLSSVLSSTKPPADFGDKNVNAQVVVFSPEQDKTTDSYETVEVN